MFDCALQHPGVESGKLLRKVPVHLLLRREHWGLGVSLLYVLVLREVRWLFIWFIFRIFEWVIKCLDGNCSNYFRPLKFFLSDHISAVVVLFICALLDSWEFSADVCLCYVVAECEVSDFLAVSVLVPVFSFPFVL